MVEIKILGSGCAKCAKLAANADAAAQQIGIDYRIDKVTDRDAIIDAGVMFTPALVVDGEVRTSGKVPSVDQLKALLR